MPYDYLKRAFTYYEKVVKACHFDLLKYNIRICYLLFNSWTLLIMHDVSSSQLDLRYLDLHSNRLV
jgi:hypothetical protein